MSGETKGLRGRIRRAIEAPVSESEKLLSELKDPSVETKLSILISGWGRGLAGGLEELAIAVDELLERDARTGRAPAGATAPAEPALQPSPEEEPAADSARERTADPTEEQLLEQARKSREQTAELREEAEKLGDDLAP